MVLKPADFIARGEKGLFQPAMKVRGRSYLRIIHGLNYARQRLLNAYGSAKVWPLVCLVRRR